MVEFVDHSPIPQKLFSGKIVRPSIDHNFETFFMKLRAEVDELIRDQRDHDALLKKFRYVQELYD